MPTGHAEQAQGFELGAMKAPMSRAPQSEQGLMPGSWVIGMEWLWEGERHQGGREGE
jgi:hypothetical protein